MQIGMVGLGKMGGNMTSRLLASGHRVVAFDLNEAAIEAAETEGAVGARSLEELIDKLSTPHIVWVMVPPGSATDNTLNHLAGLLSPGDIVIDGGNSNYKDTLRRSALLRDKEIYLVDAGTSGGIWGLTEGYSLMIGGDDHAVSQIRPVLETLAPGTYTGWGHVGPSGSGHFVKMIHNGIEYGMMQAYAEGFEIMKAKKEFDLDLHQVANIWRYGSVIRSWLLDLTTNALQEDQDLSDIRGWVADSGEGRWAVFEAVDLDIPAPVITASLQARFISRQEESYAAKLLAAMRNQFGGHEVKKSG